MGGRLKISGVEGKVFPWHLSKAAPVAPLVCGVVFAGVARIAWGVVKVVAAGGRMLLAGVKRGREVGKDGRGGVKTKVFVPSAKPFLPKGRALLTRETRALPKAKVLLPKETFPLPKAKGSLARETSLLGKKRSSLPKESLGLGRLCSSFPKECLALGREIVALGPNMDF